MNSRYEIMYPDAGVMSKFVRASSIEEAAENFAREKDSDWDYTLLNGNTMGLLIRFNNSDSPFKYFNRDPEKDCLGEWEYFEVTGESVPQYNANPVNIPTHSDLWKDILEYISEEEAEGLA